MKFIKILTVILFLRTETTQCIAMVEPQAEVVQKKHCFTQPLPQVIQALIEMLNNSYVTNGYSELNCWNSLLICGPAGNGKTTYAHTIVEQTGAKLIELSGTYFTSKEYDGIERLRNVYRQLKETAEQTNKPVVLLIKDADVITDHSTQCALWCLIDKIRYDSRMLVIATVKKHLGIFDARISSRMRSLEVENPTYEQRIKLFTFFWNNKSHRTLPQNLLQTIAKESTSLSIKEIKSIVITSFNAAQKEGLILPDEDIFFQEIHVLQNKKYLKRFLHLKDSFIAKTRTLTPFIFATATTYYILKTRPFIKKNF